MRILTTDLHFSDPISGWWSVPSFFSLRNKMSRYGFKFIFYVAFCFLSCICPTRPTKDYENLEKWSSPCKLVNWTWREKLTKISWQNSKQNNFFPFNCCYMRVSTKKNHSRKEFQTCFFTRRILLGF